MAIELRRAGVDDMKELRDVSIETFVATFGTQNRAGDIDQYVTESFSPEVLTVQLNDPDTVFYLAETDDRVAGYAKLNVGAAQTEPRGGDALEVQRIYVRGQFKRHGLGRLMIERAIDEAASRGLSRVWLGVWEHNGDALQFYRSLGFEVVGSHVFTLGGDDQTDLIMEKRVGGR